MISEQIRELERQLWAAADNLRANSDLKSTEYATPVLGLIFLKFADNKYKQHEPAILKEFEKLKGGRREKPLSEIAIEKCGFYLPDHARYDYLLELPEDKDIAAAIKKAMQSIEEYKPELDGILPQDEYHRLVTRTDKTIPKQLAQELCRHPRRRVRRHVWSDLRILSWQLRFGRRPRRRAVLHASQRRSVDGRDHRTAPRHCL